MKIGITADIHLKEKREDSPERYAALEDILFKLKNKEVGTLIVAGDLFDKECNNYSEFDEICKKNSNINFLVIPGNHDPGISSTYFTADNVEIIEKPEIRELGGTGFFFIPYDERKTMGEIIAQHGEELPEKWVLIGHGDYLSERIPENHFEVGTYMPINRSDLERFGPDLVVLGHIHKRGSHQSVHYTGSPCGLNINETGPRHFSLMDTDNLNYEAEKVDTERIYFNETLLVLPVKNEKEYAKEKIAEMINNWNISEKEMEKVELRLIIKGYSRNLKLIEEAIQEEFQGVNFYDGDGGELDFSEINILKTDERLEIAEKVKQAVEKSESLIEEKGLTKEQVLEEALKKVFN